MKHGHMSLLWDEVAPLPATWWTTPRWLRFQELSSGWLGETRGCWLPSYLPGLCILRTLNSPYRFLPRTMPAR